MMARTSILLSVCILVFQARTCGGDEVSVEKPPVKAAVDLSDPYEVAGRAFEAYRDRDLEAYSALLLEPPGPGAKVETVFKYEITDLDEIQGLFFLDEGKTIAAIIRPSLGETLAMWFRIVRTDDGFRVEKMLITDQTPPTDVPVEG